MPFLTATGSPGVATWAELTTDGTFVLAPGGAALGAYAIDLQASRTAATQTATGTYGNILGGRNTENDAEYAVAFGDGVYVGGAEKYTLALGTGVSAAGTGNNTLIGYGAAAGVDAEYSLAIGTNSFVGYNYNMVIGHTAQVYDGRFGRECIAIGRNAYAMGYNSVALGPNTRAINGGYYGCFAIGSGASGAAPYASGLGSLAVGSGSIRALTDNTIAIGSGGGYAAAQYSIALGTGQVNATGTFGVALAGRYNLVSAPYAIAAGRSALGDMNATFAWSGNTVGGNAERGKSQAQLLHLDAATVADASANLVSVTAVDGEISVADGATFHIFGRVICWNETATAGSVWNIDVLAVNNGGALTLVTGALAGAAPAAGDDGAVTLTVAAAGTLVRFTGTGIADGATRRWSAGLYIARATA